MTTTQLLKQAKDWLENNFPPQIIARGSNIYQRGQIKGCRVGENNDVQAHIEALVEGDTGNLYETSLYLDNDDITTYCTCPYEFQCKHGAALAIHYHCLIKRKPHQDTRHALRRWTAELHKYATTPLSSNSHSDWSTFFQFAQETDRLFTLSSIQRYRKKNGDWGRSKTVPPWELSLLESSSYDERACCRLLENAEVEYTDKGNAFVLADELGHLLLTHAVNSKKLIDEQGAPINLGPERTLKETWRNSDSGTRLTFALEGAEHAGIIPVTPLLYHCDNHIGPVNSALTAEQYALLSTIPEVDATSLPDITAAIVTSFGPKLISLPEKVSFSSLDSPTPKATLHCLNFGANGRLPALRLSVCYGAFEYPLDERKLNKALTAAQDGISIHSERVNDHSYRIERQLSEEASYIKQIRVEPGFMPYNPDTNTEYFVPPEVSPQRHLAMWQSSLPRMEKLFSENGWNVAVDDSYQFISAPINAQTQFEDSEHGWFTLQLSMEIEGHTFDTGKIISQWLASNTADSISLQTEGGQWVLADMTPFQSMYATLVELFSEEAGNRTEIKLPPYKALAFDALEDSDYRTAPKLQALRKKLTNFKGLKPVALPSTVKAQLRDYQQHGFNWMMFLHNYQFGGILADDMGLGKTLQTLAFIQKLKSSRKLTHGALVIAPASVLWNWQAEAEKFTPSLSVLIWHGSDRKQHAHQLDTNNLVLTSYALAHRDNALLQKQHFDMIVLDEAQYVKNPKAKTAKAVRQLSANMRLCLTGTPLENHLGELWALMDFALPGLLGNEDFFKKTFRQPIENDNHELRRQELAARVAPFMLRRTKEKVARELPEKTEIEQIIHLDGEQQRLYESIRVSMEKRVRELIAVKGMAKSHIEFLDALLKLRQACIAPQLVKLEQAKQIKTAAKLDWLIDNLPEMISEGRRILIFSQFTQMLSLIGEQLDEFNIGYCKLTGRTKNRKKVVGEFQDGLYPIFLISLKAGGAGLNLTAADTVIHVDPWWNPAAENQATDRAYRIGQDKPVFVYKLIAQGTVEEKIQAMQKHKQSLADALFENTQKAALPTSSDELLALFT